MENQTIMERSWALTVKAVLCRMPVGIFFAALAGNLFLQRARTQWDASAGRSLFRQKQGKSSFRQSATIPLLSY
jgi:hypothetical protein